MTRRQQSEADMSLPAAVARLTDRVDRLQQETHQHRQTIKTLSARLRFSEQREQALLRWLALKRTDKRRKSYDGQMMVLML